MVKNERPYILHDGNEYQCYLAGYLNPVQHKWSFVIDGVDSSIRSQSKIHFLGLDLTVCFSERRDALSTKMFNNTSGKETYFEAWLI